MNETLVASDLRVDPFDLNPTLSTGKLTSPLVRDITKQNNICFVI
jgi:hypothetical protein